MLLLAESLEDPCPSVYDNKITFVLVNSLARQNYSELKGPWLCDTKLTMRKEILTLCAHGHWLLKRFVPQGHCRRQEYEPGDFEHHNRGQHKHLCPFQVTIIIIGADIIIFTIKTVITTIIILTSATNLYCNFLFQPGIPTAKCER